MKREIVRPERRRVTVCIAATCNAHTNDQRIVLCTDGLMSSGLGKVDERLKIRPTDNWHILTAGRDDDIVATTNHIKDQIIAGSIKNSPIEDDVRLVEAVRASLSQRKRERADEIIHATYGISYEDLLAIGKEKLPDEVFRNALWSVRDADVDAELIVAGFEHTGFPLLVETGPRGRVSIREKFAIVGAGAALAQSVLMHRQYGDIQSVDRAVYAVYEAKRYAEGEISVGPSTHLIVLDKRGEALSVTKKGFVWLEEQYKKFGPKAIPVDLAAPRDAPILAQLKPPRPSDESDAT